MFADHATSADVVPWLLWRNFVAAFKGVAVIVRRLKFLLCL